MIFHLFDRGKKQRALKIFYYLFTERLIFRKYKILFLFLSYVLSFFFNPLLGCNERHIFHRTHLAASIFPAYSGRKCTLADDAFNNS